MIMDAVEARFTHLLQPIRDLTKNWEVDVASQLGEYLDELDQICISFDGGKTTMNFAEAALLIQGSACIYSKKVEYLYSLVYQALDFISNKKRDKQPTSIEQGGMDKDVTFSSKNKVVFLTLDDFTEKNTPNVDLRNDTAKGLEMVPLTPEPLILVDDLEKKKNPLHSHKGEILASCMDFRMNNFTPHANGSIRLYMASTPFEFLKNMHSYIQNNSVGDPNIIPEDICAQNAPLPPLNLSEVLDVGGSMDGDAGGGDMLEAFLPLEEDNGMELDHLPDTHIDRHQGPSERRMLRERPAVQPALEQKRENPDPWKCHNPFSTSEDKPLKTGKHFTIPPNVQQVSGNKRKRRGTIKLQEFLSWFTGTLSERPSRKNKKGPTFADLEDLYWSRVSERLKCLKKIHRRVDVLSNDILEQRNWDLGEAEAEAEAEVQGGQPDEFQDPDDDDDFSNHDNFADEVPAQIVEDQDQFITASQTERMTYEDLVKRSVELFLMNSQKYAQETVLSRRMKDWEEKMDPQLAAQEERLAFDIHDYGSKIMSAFSDVRERRTFASIVQGKESHEVCRYMLASLQLANDCTVEIHKQEGLEETIDSMEMTLLSKHKAHERFKTYSAPSITDTH